MTASTEIEQTNRDTLPKPVPRVILFADAVEYSRLVLEDEAGTLSFMRECFGAFRRVAEEFDGRLVKTTGDGVVLEFEDPVSAVSCALESQARLRTLNASRANRRQARFRIGIHLGEVVHDGGDIYGHSVNVAARLQSFARPEGICLSRDVRDRVLGRLDVRFSDMGLLQLRNIAGPMACYRVLTGLEDEADAPTSVLDDVCLSVIDGVSYLDVRGIPQVPRSKRAGAILGYLALTERFQEFRDRLAALFWSEVDSARARQSLTRCIASLQKTLDTAGGRWLSADGVVRLKLSGANIDLIALSAALTEGRVSDAFVYGKAKPENIMAGFDVVDRAFGVWLQVTRSTWRGRLVQQFEKILADIQSSVEQRNRAAQALRQIDPLHEPAARHLMQEQASAGNLSAALRLFHELAEELKRQFNAEPSAETRSLIERLRLGERLPPSSTLTGLSASSARLPSIEVSDPILEADGAALHLVEGFRRDLIANLVRQRDWIIVDARMIAGSGAVGRKADYRLDLLCGKSHSGFDVSLSLVDSTTGRHIWADRCVLELDRWEQTQLSAVRSISGKLGIYISVERRSGQLDGEDASLTAYDQWLRGEHLLDSWAPAAEREAEKLFQGVIEEMPKFAPAYSSLASIYNVQHLINVGSPRDPAAEARAMKLAQTAVDLDPLDTRAHLTLAWSYCMASQFGRAELHYDLARELNPNNPRTLISAAQGLAFTNAIGKAAQLAQQAIDIAPFLSAPQWAYVAAVRFLAGDYEGALEASKTAGAIVDVAAWEAAALTQLGRRDDAREAALRLIADVKERWTGLGGPPNTAEILPWLLNCYPIRPGPAADRFRDALSSAVSLLH